MFLWAVCSKKIVGIPVTDCSSDDVIGSYRLYEDVLKWHDEVIKWKHFPRYWPFARGIHRSPVNSPHKGHWRGSLMFSLICAWIHGWVNNREAGDSRRHRAHYEVTVMKMHSVLLFFSRIICRSSMDSLLKGSAIWSFDVCFILAWTSYWFEMP